MVVQPESSQLASRGVKARENRNIFKTALMQSKEWARRRAERGCVRAWSVERGSGERRKSCPCNWITMTCVISLRSGSRPVRLLQGPELDSVWLQVRTELV